jgi:hypothetical protein
MRVPHYRVVRYQSANRRADQRSQSTAAASRKELLSEHGACRHSAGHMYPDDTELSSIPPRIADRASRVGYKLKSFITWRKHSSTPEPAKSRVSRQAEYLLHLSVERTPFFDKGAWQTLSPELGGPNMIYESAEKITDVWCLPTSSGKNGHGAEFPLALAGRCIALTSRTGDLVLDPFVGSGTTAIAAAELGRRFVGYDISKKYIDVAERRVFITVRGRQLSLEEEAIDTSVQMNGAPEIRTPNSTRRVSRPGANGPAQQAEGCGVSLSWSPADSRSKVQTCSTPFHDVGKSGESQILSNRARCANTFAWGVSHAASPTKP